MQKVQPSSIVEDLLNLSFEDSNQNKPLYFTSNNARKMLIRKKRKRNNSLLNSWTDWKNNPYFPKKYKIREKKLSMPRKEIIEPLFDNNKTKPIQKVIIPKKRIFETKKRNSINENRNFVSFEDKTVQFEEQLNNITDQRSKIEILNKMIRRGRNYSENYVDSRSKTEKQSNFLNKKKKGFYKGDKESILKKELDKFYNVISKSENRQKVENATSHFDFKSEKLELPKLKLSLKRSSIGAEPEFLIKNSKRKKIEKRLRVLLKPKKDHLKLRKNEKVRNYQNLIEYQKMKSEIQVKGNMRSKETIKSIRKVNYSMKEKINFLSCSKKDVSNVMRTKDNKFMASLIENLRKLHTGQDLSRVQTKSRLDALLGSLNRKSSDLLEKNKNKKIDDKEYGNSNPGCSKIQFCRVSKKSKKKDPMIIIKNAGNTSL